jgi:hypothetical protein
VNIQRDYWLKDSIRNHPSPVSSPNTPALMLSFKNTAKPIQSKRDLNLQTFLIPKNSLYRNNMEGDVIGSFLERRFT